MNRLMPMMKGDGRAISAAGMRGSASVVLALWMTPLQFLP